MSITQNPTWSGFGMNEDPRVQSESTNGASTREQGPTGQATEFFSDPSNLAQVAQTLAAHGGGAVSVELALDLVLNEVVEQARNATGATGAAVALFRDGELSCRATTGESSPDLGVRVDATSGLAGAFIPIEVSTAAAGQALATIQLPTGSLITVYHPEAFSYIQPLL